MRILFAGTPYFSVLSLEKLSSNFNIVGVLTTPDKPKGRGKKLGFLKVKEKALELGLNIFQPQRFDKDFYQTIKNQNIDILVVVAYGKIFKKDFVKSRAQLEKKGLMISEDELRTTVDQKPDWTSKRLPKQVITQGFLDQKQYEIAHFADGFHTIAEIAEEAGIPEAEVQSIIDSLDNLGLLRFIEIK